MKHSENSLPLKPAKITFRNILAVLQAFFVKKALHIDGVTLDQHIFEQIIWRRTQVRAKSPNCWLSGECVVCGCEILGKTMEDRGCSAGEHPELNREPCYPEMMDKKEWKEYKKLNRIKLFD